MFEGQKDNMALWNRCRFIDPAFTKTFTRAGGFSGRSTNATYVVMRATEEFGPVGTGWGWDIIDSYYIDGAPMIADDGTNYGHEKLHVVRASVWYIQDGVKCTGVAHFGQTTFVGMQKRGGVRVPVSDEEHAKKSLTDAITKALSCIGFAAEIHLGKWDDNKYVSDMQVEARERAAPAKPLFSPTHDGGYDDLNAVRQSEPASRPAAAVVPVHPHIESLPWPPDGGTTGAIENVRNDINEQTTYDGIKKAVSVGYALAREYGNEKLHEEFKALATERWAKVRSAPKVVAQ